MQYIIEEIKGSYDAQYGSKRVVFTVKNYPHDLSTFSKSPEKMVPGASIEGSIAVTEKDGKQYHNFKFPVKNDVRNDEKMEQILNKLTGISMKLDVIGSILQGKKHVEAVADYPENNEDVPF